MSKYNYSKEEQKINNVLQYQREQLDNIVPPDMSEVEKNISESEELLKSLGYSRNTIKTNTGIVPSTARKPIIVPGWEELCAEAEINVGSNNDLESLFTAEEIKANEEAIRVLNEEYNSLYKLDKFDIAISALAGIVGAAADILLVGIPKRGADGLEAAPLSDFIRKRFDEKFPQDEMEKLANSTISKVPYDAQDNRNTGINVEGLSTYYHRLLSLGHDPLLGFVVGVLDIFNGRMTTIDKKGKIVSQVMENYSDRKESEIFAALSKQVIHFKSDVNTSMGLPVPLMGLFNLLQFGNIAEEEQTVAEIVQGMYYEGYDFIHFCSMSIPTMIVEVIIRLGYALKHIKEGHSVKDSIPLSLDRKKQPKLATMLFIGHTSATAINVGKMYFATNPFLAINYPQWIAFAKYSYKQFKWALIEKAELRDEFVSNKLERDFIYMTDAIDHTSNLFSNDYVFVFR
jgi:hypothetical protein